MAICPKKCVDCGHEADYEVVTQCNDCGNKHRFTTSYSGGKKVEKCTQCNSTNVGVTEPKCVSCNSENLETGIAKVGFVLGKDWTYGKSASAMADYMTADDRGNFPDPY